MKEIQNICGETRKIDHDEKIKKLNLELAHDNGTPLIILQDWTNKSKDILTLHIQEAVELKSIIDNLIVDWNWNRRDLLNERILKLEAKK